MYGTQITQIQLYSKVSRLLAFFYRYKRGTAYNLLWLLRHLEAKELFGWLKSCKKHTSSLPLGEVLHMTEQECIPGFKSYVSTFTIKLSFPFSIQQYQSPKGHFIQQWLKVASIFNIQIYSMNSQQGIDKNTGLNKRFQQQTMTACEDLLLLNSTQRF